MKLFANSLTLYALFLSIFIIPGCSCDKASEPVAAAAVVEVPKLMVVNIADSDIFNECHIKGSTAVDFGDVESAFKNIDKNTPIVTYCANYACTASGSVAEMLQAMGFKNVKAFEGGIAQWYQKGYPIEGSCAKQDKSQVSSYLTAENIQGEHEDGSSVTEITIAQLKDEMEQAGLLN